MKQNIGFIKNKTLVRNKFLYISCFWNRFEKKNIPKIVLIKTEWTIFYFVIWWLRFEFNFVIKRQRRKI